MTRTQMKRVAHALMKGVLPENNPRLLWYLQPEVPKTAFSVAAEASMLMSEAHRPAGHDGDERDLAEACSQVSAKSPTAPSSPRIPRSIRAGLEVTAHIACSHHGHGASIALTEHPSIALKLLTARARDNGWRIRKGRWVCPDCIRDPER